MTRWIVVLIVMLGACRTGGGNVDDCDSDEEQSFCCWRGETDEESFCAVTSWCVDDTCDYTTRTVSTWTMGTSFQSAIDEWSDAPCHVRDDALDPRCEP